MSDFTYEKQVVAFGETLNISIRRYADITLVQAKDESGRAYYDNKVQLIIKRNDGSVFIDRTFAKIDFSEFTNNDYGRDGALLGFMFDTVEDNRLKFGASVGSPDPTSDEFVPIEVLIDQQGKVFFQKATSLDSGNGEEKSKTQTELEAAEAEGM
ncbi:lipoprotein [gut metagenome]|uniref:Lipoprotein n=1 Tax=gut metagenome TaxID=749906 RepID=J9C6M4_9ZZZZ